MLLTSLPSPPEFSLFLCRPGEAEAVLLVFCGAWKRSEDRPGLDLALELELADQVLWLALLLLVLLALFLLAYASAAWGVKLVRGENRAPVTTNNDKVEGGNQSVSSAGRRD